MGEGNTQSKHFLVVGYGSIGKRHIANIGDMYPEATISLLRHNSGLSEKEMQKHAITNCYTSLQEAIESRPKYAILANPASLHLDIANSLAEHGIHLLIEKPLAVDTQGVEQLLATCRNNSVQLLVGYNLRFLPSLQKFRALVQENYIGTPLSVRAEVGQNLKSWRPDMDYRQSVSAQRSLGGGALLELSHEIDYLLWLFRSITSVSGVTPKSSKLEIDVEDSVHAVLEFQPTKGSMIYGTLSMDFVRQDPVRTCVVIGSRGSLRWDCLRGTIEQFRANDGQWTLVYGEQEEVAQTYTTELRHFLDCVHGYSSPCITGKDGYAVLQVVDAIRRSSESRYCCVVK